MLAGCLGLILLPVALLFLLVVIMMHPVIGIIMTLGVVGVVLALIIGFKEAAKQKQAAQDQATEQQRSTFKRGLAQYRAILKPGSPRPGPNDKETK